jgi:hypothetical protein
MGSDFQKTYKDKTMETATAMTVKAAIAQLTANLGKTQWVSHALPAPDPELYKQWAFSREQFLLAQEIVSGASLGPDLEGSINFLEARRDRLHEEAQGNWEDHGVYQLGNSYCQSGWQEYTDDEGEEFLLFWYETTSGTLLFHQISEQQENWGIYLPKSREGGRHDRELTRVHLGMTSEQYHRWYNSDCLGDNKIPDYSEWAGWHNEHMVPEGWPPMLNGEQFLLQRRIDRALGYIHGDWSQDYGIGHKIAEIIDFHPKRVQVAGYPSKAASKSERLRLGRSILEDLERAATQWAELLSSWQAEPGPVETEYEGSGEDYIYEEDCDYSEVAE